MEVVATLRLTSQRPGFKFQHIPQGRKSPARWEVSRNVATTSTGVQDQEQLRARLNNYQMMLTITLGDERTGKYDYARSPFDFAENPAGYDKRVYGTGFQVGFINDRWLASVTERNLETLERKAEKKWVCPAEYRFAVPKIEDSAECSASVDPASLNSRQTAVRRALTSADWELNWTGDGQSGPHPLGRCAVPKKLGSKDLCYSPDEKYVHYISFCFAE